MKFVLALGFLFVASVVAIPTPAPAAQHNGRVLLEMLEKRGEALLVSAKKVIAAHKGSKDHLLGALEHQVGKVEALVADVKKALADKDAVHHLHHIHVIEEELFHLENRVSEEIAAINHVIDPKHPPKGETVEQIIARAEKLVKEAKEAIAKHPYSVDVADIDRELIVINALISAIKAKPSPADLKKEEEELARQEKSLQQLMDRLKHRKN